MTKRISTPEHALTIRTYDDLHQFVQAFSHRKLNLLIIVGRAGTAKSQSVRRACGSRVCWIESNASAFGIYSQLYHHQNELTVIDDVDSLYSDKSSVRLLKCLCQTDPVKNVAWHTNAACGDLPRQFTTSSQVCIIANDWKTLDANTAAVQDRGHLLIFDPSPEKMHRQVATWFWDQVVFNWFAEHLHLVPNLSMRHYVRAAELRSANMDWVRILLADSVPEKALLVAKLKADPQYTEERQRVEAFRALGGGSHTTWYKWAKRVSPPHDAEPLRILLQNAADDRPRESAA